MRQTGAARSNYMTLYCNVASRTMQQSTVLMLLLLLPSPVTSEQTSELPPGPPGPPGDTGATGDTGFAGFDGYTGRYGRIGDTGSTGLPGNGPLGLPGKTGPAGFDGYPGVRGDTGASGMSGELGPTGAIGATGAWLKQNSLLSMRSARASIKLDCIGPPGPPGEQGATGATGATGHTGRRGHAGITGIIGSTGQSGPTGGYGPRGVRGPRGRTGETGQRGVRGMQGSTGDTGFTGDTGATGTRQQQQQQLVRRRAAREIPRCPGPKGLPGIQGVRGQTGAMGATGFTGAQGGTGLPGLPGVDGTVALIGPTGWRGPRGQQGLKGPSGYRGDVGARGETGYTGATGATGFIRAVGSVRPLYGPVSGGTPVTITGSFFSLVHVTVVHFGQYSTREVVKVSEDSLVVLTPFADAPSRHLPIRLQLFDAGEQWINTQQLFDYLPSPVFTDFQPRNHLTVGGTIVTVYGRYLNSVAAPRIIVRVDVTRFVNNVSNVTDRLSQSESCWFAAGNEDETVKRSLMQSAASTSMLCRMPRLPLPADLSRRLAHSESGTISDSQGPGVAVYSVGDDRADIYVGLQLDGLKRYHDISSVNSSVKMQYSLPPDLFCRSDEPQVFDPAADRLLHIKGRYLTRGSRLVDFLVTLGDGMCVPVSLVDNQLDCRPPTSRPGRLNSTLCHADRDALSLKVSVGNANYLCSCVRYVMPMNWLIIIIIIAACVAFVIVIVIVIIIVIVVVCRRRRGGSKIDSNSNFAVGSTSMANPAYNATVSYDVDHDSRGYSRHFPDESYS